MEHGGPQRLPFLQYFNVVEWENRLTSGLNAAKSTNIIEKPFEQKLYKIKFFTKNLGVACFYPPKEWS